MLLDASTHSQTAIKLQDGSVWLAASHPLTPSTLTTLSEIGPIKHIVMVSPQPEMLDFVICLRMALTTCDRPRYLTARR